MNAHRTAQKIKSKMIKKRKFKKHKNKKLKFQHKQQLNEAKNHIFIF